MTAVLLVAGVVAVLSAVLVALRMPSVEPSGAARPAAGEPEADGPGAPGRSAGGPGADPGPSAVPAADHG